ncbi:hypothetical protein [Lentilitoribacter sp. Alg239-R112]|uniref:hypothetical protein n=1 Tax=Lentilitoribacter sp. Alg239-R112 TaxID=2305987 RepID=UPI0013A6AF52|nr:hypothetical protein [Lentilitoribacter sp. Alg239-R112]
MNDNLVDNFPELDDDQLKQNFDNALMSWENALDEADRYEKLTNSIEVAIEFRRKLNARLSK